MIIKLITIGKTNGAWLVKGITEYTNRLTHYTNFKIIEIPEVKNKAKLSVEKLKEAEQTEIEKHFDKDSFIIALDENGKEYSSEDFSIFLEKKMIAGIKQIIFIIVGSFCISSKILANCNDKIALSQMTFSHQMVRLIFVEQLYRAFTIIKNEKYHHK
ncbi:MAG: 23S rRNA (pseudouridine(1915)-N(3))-methyltransferase RlmH [Bacteroidia bacterium]